MSRRAAIRWLLAAALVLPGGAPTAEERSANWTVTGPAAVLESCYQGAEGPVFTDGEGRDWPLITDPNDPAITNPGTGRFWPAPAVWVEQAIAALPAEVTHCVAGRIAILPFPRRGLTRSSCDGRTIYLSPGVRPLTREQVHFYVFHEVGHLIQRQLLPDWDAAGWRRYRQLRGIEDLRRFHADAPHGDQPHEVLAEDFRCLFGSLEARAVAPLIPSSAPPLDARGPAVRAFLEGLLQPAVAER